MSRNRKLYLHQTQKYLDVKHKAVRAALVATGLLLGLFLRLLLAILCRHNDAFQRLSAPSENKAGMQMITRS